MRALVLAFIAVALLHIATSGQNTNCVNNIRPFEDGNYSYLSNKFSFSFNRSVRSHVCTMQFGSALFKKKYYLVNVGSRRHEFDYGLISGLSNAHIDGLLVEDNQFIVLTDHGAEIVKPSNIKTSLEAIDLIIERNNEAAALGLADLIREGLKKN